MTNIIIRVTKEIEPPIQYYRVPHDIERYSYNAPEDWRYGGDGYRAGKVREAAFEIQSKTAPEVYRFKTPYDFNTPLSCSHLKMWRAANPKLTTKSWGTLLGSELAWMNNTGSPPHSNCVTGYIGDAKSPSFCVPILNGGAVVRGRESNGYLEVESLLLSGPIPSAEELINKPWLWYWGTAVRTDGNINLITRLGTDGYRYPVRIPFITRYPVKWPLSYFHKLPLGSPIPDPRWMA